MSPNKKAKGIMTFIAIIIIIAGALFGSILYENKITANAAKELEINDRTMVHYSQVQNVDDLNFLNEGWYQIKSGYVYYLEYFDNAIPIFVKVKNPAEQNGMLVVNSDGSTSFDNSFDGLPEQVYDDENPGNEITGEVTGLEDISGMQSASVPWTFNSVLTLGNGERLTATTTTGVWQSSNGNRYDSDGYRLNQQGQYVSASGIIVSDKLLAQRHSQASEIMRLNGRTPVAAPTIQPAGQTQTQTTTFIWTQNGIRTESPTPPPVGTAYQTLVKNSNGQERLTDFDASNQQVRAMIRVTANNKEQANDAGQRLAQLRGATFDRIEMPRFSLSSPQTGEQIIEASSRQAAIDEYRRRWGTNPSETTELLPGQAGSRTQTYEIIVPGGERFTFNANSLEEAQAILINYQGNPMYVGRNLQLNKLPTMEDLRARNPGVPDNILRKELENIISQRNNPQQNQLAPPTHNEIKDANGNVIAWYVNDVRYTNENEYQAALSAANARHSQVVSERFARGQLEGRTLTGEITTSGDIIARDNNGLYRFVPTKDGSGIVTGGSFQPIAQGQTYTVMQQIGASSYPIEFRVGNNGQRTPISITIDGSPREVTPEQLNFLRENVDSQDKLSSVKENEIVITRPERTFNERNGRTRTINERIVTTPNGITRQSVSRERDSNENTVVLSVTTLFEGKDGKMSETRINYFLTGEQTSIDESTSDYEEITKNSLTGEPEKIRIKKNGDTSEASAVSGELSYGEAAQKLASEKTKWKSRRAFLSVERALTEFRGLGYYASLFWEDDQLLQWRNEVDEQFAKFYLGTEYWVSDICGKNIDDEGIGVAYAETPQGLAQIGAHIEATRTPAINNGTDNYYIYKITFNVRNGDWENDPRAPEKLMFNVELKRAAGGTGGQAVPRTNNVILFNKEIEVPRGSTYGKTGENAIVKESQALYSEICMKFSSALPSRWRVEDSELCTPVQVSSAVPTKIRQAASATSPGQDPNINDF